MCYTKISEFNVQTLRVPISALSDVSLVCDRQHTLAYGHRTKKYGFVTKERSATLPESVIESYHPIPRRRSVSVYLVAWPSPR